MQYISSTCTNCNAVLQVDRNKSTAICPYCGTIFTSKHDNNEYSGGSREIFVVRAGLLCQYNGVSASPVIPDAVVKLIHGVFSNLPISEITIPDSVRIIENKTFERCKSLVSIVIPDSVSDFGFWIFDECVNLKSIVMPRFFRDNTGRKHDITNPLSREDILGRCQNLQVIRNSNGDLLWSREYEIVQRKKQYEKEVFDAQAINQTHSLAIASICTCWLPFMGIILGVITLIKINKAIDNGVDVNRIKMNRVIPILAMLVNVIFTIAWFA